MFIHPAVGQDSLQSTTGGNDWETEEEARRWAIVAPKHPKLRRNPKSIDSQLPAALSKRPNDGSMFGHRQSQLRAAFPVLCYFHSTLDLDLDFCLKRMNRAEFKEWLAQSSPASKTIR